MTGKEIIEEVVNLQKPSKTNHSLKGESEDSTSVGYLVTDNQGIIQEADHAVAVLLQTASHRLRGKSLVTFVIPEDRDQFQASLTRLQENNKPQELTISLRPRDGKALLVSLAVTIKYNTRGKPDGFQWLVRNLTGQAQGKNKPQTNSNQLEQRVQEHTSELLLSNQQLALEVANRKKAEEELRQVHEELERRVKERTAELAAANERLQFELAERQRVEASAAQRARELSALHTATAALLSTLDLEALLGQILDAATSAIPAAEKGMLHLIAPDTGQLEMRATIGYADARIQKFTFPGSRGYVARAVQGRKPLLIRDVQTDPSLRYEGKIPEARAIQSVIVAPLIEEDQVLGALSLEASRKAAFSEDDLRLLVSFAATATAAIQNAQLHAEVQKLAITDALTGLYNRRGFAELSRREVERLRRFSHPLSAIMIDLDYFKNINDTYGHSIGDQALRAIAKRLSSNIREVDILGRYGGDEFSILLPETELFTATNIGERLRHCVADLPLTIGVTSIPITISAGIVKATAETPNLETLLERADKALYVAKQGGRNRVEVR